MCELTLTSVRDAWFNQLYITNQLTLNSIDHPHGTGVFHIRDGKAQVIKENMPASSILNFGQIFAKHLTNSPVIGHVRKASTWGVGKEKRENLPEHVHPFVHEGLGLTLAHNGTLTLDRKDSKYDLKDPRFEGMIDSQVYFEVFCDYYAELQDVPKALVAAMEHFDGKFAFLVNVHNKKEEAIYIVRGLAPLHTAKVFFGEKYVGLVVNTEKLHMQRALCLTSSLRNIVYPACVIYQEVDLLKAETIFKLSKDGLSLEEICEIKQTTEYSRYPKATKRSENYSPFSYGVGDSNSGIDLEKDHQVVESVLKWMGKYALSLPEMDVMLIETVGVPLLGLCRETWSTFLELYAGMFSVNGITRRTRLGAWLSLRGSYEWDVLAVYRRYNLEFPYMLNDTMTLEYAIMQKEKYHASDNFNGKGDSALSEVADEVHTESC